MLYKGPYKTTPHKSSFSKEYNHHPALMLVIAGLIYASYAITTILIAQDLNQQHNNEYNQMTSLLQASNSEAVNIKNQRPTE